MNLKDAGALAITLMTSHGINQRWDFYFDSAQTRLGMCSPRQRRISLSRSYVESAEEPNVRDTILHEIAHALAFEKYPHRRVGHGPEWKAIALSIGCSGSRTGKSPAHAALQGDRKHAAISGQHSFAVPLTGKEAGALSPGARVVLTAPGQKATGDVFIILRATRSGYYRALHPGTDKEWRLHVTEFRLHVDGEPLDRVSELRPLTV